MLPRKNLIALRAEFGRIKRDGKTYDTPLFGMLVAYGASDGAKAAFLVSKKVDRRSVVRHEVKRKIALAIGPFLARLARNVELVFLAKKKAAGVGGEEMGRELEAVLRRARLL